jgi:hypothetical protein
MVERPATARYTGRWSVVALPVGFVLVLAVAWLIFRPVAPDSRAGLRPEPLEPFGNVSVDSLEFVWARPSDGAPVRVEVLDPGLALLWHSEATTGGSIRPPDDVLESLPRGDLVWRAVAVDEEDGERPGDAAAFFLVER